MAIEFNCPHCQHLYKLKDELGGKTATCKTCRQKITIPLPVTIPDGAEAMDAAAAEALALAALSDEPAKVEQEAASKLIPVECQYCGHKWTEPITRAGKNALCPNPECRQRIKIPEPKDEGQYDWRQTKTKGPSLAKDKIQKLEGVQDVADAKIVSGTALKEAGAIEEDIEPRPLKQKVMFVMLALGLVAGLFFGGRYLLRDRTAGKEDRLMREALDEFAKSEGLAKEEVPVYTGLLHTAAAEHALRHDSKEKLKEAMDQFGKARAALRPAVGPVRNAAVAELAATTILLGGTEEQARDQTRIRWMPDPALKLKPNERVYTVFEELNQTLDLVQPADPEFRNHLVRRLAREMIHRGQAALALELLPRALFAQPEQPEARAVVALEIYRADRNSQLPRAEAEKLAKLGSELSKGTPPASVYTLFLVLEMDKTPPIPNAPVGGTLADSTRYTYTGSYLLKDRADESLKLAQIPGKPEAQLRCLTLYADWAADPGPALDAAMAVVMSNKDKKDVSLSQAAIHRLAQIAAEKGKHEQAKEFAAKLTDEGLKAWARGDTIRLRLAGAKEKGDEAWSDLPDDPRKFRAGHAWGRLVIARNNTRLSGDRTAEARAVSSWPTPLGTFGKAGVALGLQDRDK